MDQTARRAHEAYLASAARTPGERAAWLTALAEALRSNADALVGLAVAETNLTEARLRGELRRTAFQLDLFAEELRSGVVLEATIDHADPDWGMGPRPDIRRVNVPLGVIGVFGASNFPFAFSVIGGDSASALAAGCAVLHKIHPGHENLARRTADIVIAALERAGAPKGLFAVIEGREAAVAMVEHPLVKAIGFTGSTAGGRALYDIATSRPEPIPFYGELGSINPVFVLPQAWRRRSAEILNGYAESFTLGMGQFCTKPGVLFVPNDSDDEAIRAGLADTLADVQPGKLLTPALRDSYASALAAVAGVRGVQVLLPGSDEDAPAPTVLAVKSGQVVRTPEVLHREIFGPATLLVRYQSAAELPVLAELMGGQLTATIHGDDDDDTAALVNTLTGKAGRVLFNGWPTGVTVSYAQHHGGPYPATTAASATSVGTGSIGRFMRPVAYQDLPDPALPPSLQEANPWGIARRVNGRFQSNGRR
ncbi:aldehyde dehydrogenase (NADP(+)) [Arthrobacter sp. MPF02]|uniref:aldehyde dehydrogenase (NADP(+)) n=1 Tax=Arthrobacter sp. MPF02 TaxID=3388492 RepID=UPI0039852737